MKEMFKKIGRRLLIAFSLLIISCTAQVNKSQTESNANPDIQYRVNKRSDEKGNLISYDSTWAFSWRSSAGNADSLWLRAERLRKEMDGFGSGVPSLFAADSLFFNGHDPFFFRHYQDMRRQMMELFQSAAPQLRPLPQPWQYQPLPRQHGSQSLLPERHDRPADKNGIGGKVI